MIRSKFELALFRLHLTNTLELLEQFTSIFRISLGSRAPIINLVEIYLLKSVSLQL